MFCSVDARALAGARGHTGEGDGLRVGGEVLEVREGDRGIRFSRKESAWSSLATPRSDVATGQVASQ
jgi:hypothetical protein